MLVYQRVNIIQPRPYREVPEVVGALVEVLAQLSALTREAAPGAFGGLVLVDGKHGKNPWGTSEHPKNQKWEKHVRKAIGMWFTCFTMENRESWGKSSHIWSYNIIYVHIYTHNIYQSGWIIPTSPRHHGTGQYVSERFFLAPVSTPWPAGLHHPSWDISMGYNSPTDDIFWCIWGWGNNGASTCFLLLIFF